MKSRAIRKGINSRRYSKQPHFKLKELGANVIACKPEDMSLNRYTRTDSNNKEESYVRVNFSGDLAGEETKTKVTKLMLSDTIVMMSLEEYESLVGSKITE